MIKTEYMVIMFTNTQCNNDYIFHDYKILMF